MGKNKFKFFRQIDQKDCGPTCLRMVAMYHGKRYSREYLRSLTSISKVGVTLAGIAEAAEKIGFRTLGIKVKPEILLEQIPTPFILPWRQRHFVTFLGVKKGVISVADPAFGIIKYSKEEFLNGWLNDQQMQSNYVLVLDPTPDFYVNEEDKNANRKVGFRFLLPYFRPHGKIIFQILLGLTLGLILQFSLPFLMQSIVDYGVNFQDIGFIYVILIAQVVLFLSATSVRIIRDWLILHMSSRINIKMVSDFLMKILNLPLSYFETRNMGEHMQRIRDHSRVQAFLSATTLTTAFSFITLIVFSLILLYYSLPIFLIFASGSVLFVLWSLYFLRQREILDFKRFDKLAENDSSLVEIINGVYEIKINNSKFKQRWKWESIQVELFKLSLKSLGLSQSQTIGASVINELKNIVITFVAATSVVKGNITLGMMISIQYIIGQLNIPLSNFIVFLQAGQDALISLERLSQVHEQKLEDEGKAFSNDFLDRKDRNIYLNELSFQYGGKSSPMVLKNINLTIPFGKTTAIVGASGSGKTTLLKLLLQFVHPTEGELKLGSQPFESMNTEEWRKQCGAVLQKGYLFNDTIGDNIAESEQSGIIDLDKLKTAAYVANIEDYIEKSPSGYNTLVGHSGVRLSGGQEQRIYISRAIYKDPSYFFFDEATSALDANNERVIVERMNDYLTDKTVVVIAHRLSTVKHADQIVVLHEGEIVEVGNHDQLTENQSFYYELVKNQLELGS
ncbi:ABC transporter ATP-binding protein [Lewinellaceae bacterium SD302]|nr:ABC transporter ATP-binding protein [Lewinellaceae bacterium SD302]